MNGTDTQLRDLLEKVEKQGEKIDKTAEDVAYLRGKFDSSYHTPTTCPMAADVKSLLAMKNKWIGMVAVFSALFALALKGILGWLYGE